MKKLIYLFIVLSLLGCEIEPAEPSIIGTWEITQAWDTDLIGMQYTFYENTGKWIIPEIYSEGFHWWIDGDMLYMSSGHDRDEDKAVQYSISFTGMRWINEGKETLLKRL